MGFTSHEEHCFSQMSALLECLPDPAILLSSDQVIVGANSAYRDEFANGEALIGRRCHEASHGYSQPCETNGESCPVKSCAKSREPQRVVHVHTTPRGTEHHSVTAFPIMDEQGHARAFVEVIRPMRVASAEANDHRLVGRSPAFNRMLELVHRVAPSETTVLLLGDSGTGKELIAEAIHRLSGRAQGPFVPVDCPGLNESLFESELFGHEKGSFTGAYARKLGLVEAARGGTLFLDEMGDIPPSLQVKLLRLIETGFYRRVGSVEPVRADFRLICATNRNLREMTENGAFRKDLYHRISAFPITVPPLRERVEDIPLLADSLLKRLDGQRRLRLDLKALAVLRNYSFPGNVRELLNILERASLLVDGDTIHPQDLPDECFANGSGSQALLAPRQIVPLDEMERRYLRWVTARFSGDRQLLADQLGLSERTLYRKLKGLRPPSEGPGNGDGLSAAFEGA